jgi:hypothetical protein
MVNLEVREHRQNQEGKQMLTKGYVREVTRAVKRGAKLLDRRLGKKYWPKDINLMKFRIDSPCQCVIGQLLKRYAKDHADIDDVRDTLPEVNAAYDEHYGFDYAWEYRNGAWLGSEPRNVGKVYRLLQKLWKQEIRARRAQSNG